MTYFNKKMCGPLFCHTPAAASCNLLKIAIDTHAKFGMYQGNEQSRLGLFFSVANQSQVGNFFFLPSPSPAEWLIYVSYFEGG